MSAMFKAALGAAAVALGLTAFGGVAVAAASPASKVSVQTGGSVDRDGTNGVRDADGTQGDWIEAVQGVLREAVQGGTTGPEMAATPQYKAG